MWKAAKCRNVAIFDPHILHGACTDVRHVVHCSILGESAAHDVELNAVDWLLKKHCSRGRSERVIYWLLDKHY